MSVLAPPFTLLLGTLPTFVRAELMRLLSPDPDLSVAGIAASVKELPALARKVRPGVVLVGEDSLLSLELLQRQFPVPVLLYSTRPPLPAMLREAARLGVYDYITAAPVAGTELAEWRRLLKRKLLAVRPKLVAPKAHIPTIRQTILPLQPKGVVVLGGSTGGAPAVAAILRGLPATFPWAVLVAVHLPEHFTESLVERLRRASALPVVAATNGTRLQAGQVIVARGGQNMVMSAVTDSPWPGWQTLFANETTLDVPSIDLLMHSAARTVGRNVLGVVLTGLGQDGTKGAGTIRQHGGVVVAQDEASSAVFGMPKAVVAAGNTDAVLPLSDIAGYIVRHAQPHKVGLLGRFSSLSQSVTAR
ncbi:CheB methylesterase domain-containing protein [Hymenobacter tenuis]